MSDSARIPIEVDDVDYPESDGQPPADNTRQFRIIVMIQGGPYLATPCKKRAVKTHTFWSIVAVRSRTYWDVGLWTLSSASHEPPFQRGRKQ